MVKINDEVYHKYLGKVHINKIDDNYIELYELKNVKFGKEEFESNLTTREEYVKSDFSKDMFIKSINTRNVNYIYHITTFNNLLYILKKGVIPRECFIDSKYTNDFFKDFRRNIIKVEFPDKRRLDNRLNSSCFSISRVNKTYLSVKQNEYRDEITKGNYSLCAIRLSKDAIIDNLDREYFFYHNAASKIFTKKTIDYKNYRFFNVMFYKKIKELEKYRRYNQNGSIYYDPSVRDSILKSEYTTSDQAEIMIRNIISPKYIDEIIFYNESDYKKFINFYSDNRFEIILEYN